MESNPLTPDLMELERRLLARRRAELPAALRGRVLAAARREPRRASPVGAWQFAAAMLLVALLGGNVILVSTRSTAQQLGMSTVQTEELLVAADWLQAALPEMSRQEAMQQVWLLNVRQQLVPTFPGTAASERPVGQKAFPCLTNARLASE